MRLNLECKKNKKIVNTNMFTIISIWVYRNAWSLALKMKPQPHSSNFPIEKITTFKNRTISSNIPSSQLIKTHPTHEVSSGIHFHDENIPWAAIRKYLAAANSDGGRRGRHGDRNRKWRSIMAAGQGWIRGFSGGPGRFWWASDTSAVPPLRVRNKAFSSIEDDARVFFLIWKSFEIESGICLYITTERLKGFEKFIK